MTTTTLSGLHFLAQMDLSDAFSEIGGARFVTGLTMLIHMFFAELFVGFSPSRPARPSPSSSW
jgi:hypothetical protein